MALPSSRKKLLRKALIAYLTTECQAIDSSLVSDNFSWQWYGVSPAPGELPKGLVYYPTSIPQTQNNLDAIREQYRVILQFTIAAVSMEGAVDLIEDWTEAIVGSASNPNAIMRKLFKVGYSGIIDGVSLQSVLKGIQLAEPVGNFVSQNQDNGGTATMNATYIFTDTFQVPFGVL